MGYLILENTLLKLNPSHHCMKKRNALINPKLKKHMRCAISVEKWLRGFRHLHLIIAALETGRLGTVTNGTKGSFYNSAESYSNRNNSVPKIQTGKPSLPENQFSTVSPQAAGALGTRHRKQLQQAKRDASVYKMLQLCIICRGKTLESFFAFTLLEFTSMHAILFQPKR